MTHWALRAVRPTFLTATSVDASDFHQQQKLTALGGASGDQYGVSVAIDGTTAVVGSYFDNDNGLQSGSAFVYDFNGTTGIWSFSKLTASDGEPYDQFGNAIDIDGNNVVVRFRYENTGKVPCTCSTATKAAAATGARSANATPPMAVL